MDADLLRIRVRVPESSVGYISGELSSRGAWLDQVAKEAGISTVTARIPATEVEGFRSWLDSFTRGTGELETLGTQ